MRQPSRSEIDAAKLLIKILEQDGDPVDERLRLLAACDYPVEGWSHRPLIHVGVSTRHPEDYELINHATGEHYHLVATDNAPNDRSPHPGRWVKKGY